MSLMNALRLATRTKQLTAYGIAGPSRIRTTIATLPPTPQRPIGRTGYAVIQTRRASTAPPEASPEGESILVAAPPREELERDEVDVEALGSAPTIRITERAAEVRRPYRYNYTSNMSDSLDPPSRCC